MKWNLGLALVLSVSTSAPAAVFYVNIGNLNPTAPYSTWATAATNIQDAVDTAVAGDQILVTNGVYEAGGRAVPGTLTNRVAIDKAVLVQSVNGPSVTVIKGVPQNNVSPIRCAYVGDGAQLSGFSLTNGGTLSQWQGAFEDVIGAGVCATTNAMISNCWIRVNVAGTGGGAYGGNFRDCIFEANSANYTGGGASTAVLNTCALTQNHAAYYGGGADNCSLTNCTLSQNVASRGGGANTSTLQRCVLEENTTVDDSDHTSNGGGASGGLLISCSLRGNTSRTGGGAAGSTLINCTAIGNRADTVGGGVASSVATNCLLYFNTAPAETNYSSSSTLNRCCSTPLPAGPDNISSDPELADIAHISAVSPCRWAGVVVPGVNLDLDGDPWLNPPPIGCDEFYASAGGPLIVIAEATFTNVATGFTVNFIGRISGHATANIWNFGDGTLVSNRLFVSHSWVVPGNYNLTFTAYNADHPAGVSATMTIFVLHQPVHHVALESTNPVPPYLSWATAATNMQDGVEAAFSGGTLIVSNGVYQTGSRVLYGRMTNRVAVIRPLTIQSVNGLAVTTIDGGHNVRCIYLTNGVSLTGFTLRNGTEVSGAGVYCESSDDTISDCMMIGNASPADWSVGGGVLGGVLNRCMIVSNSASYLGAGAFSATLNFCVLSNNTAIAYGGGAYASTLNNCIIAGNGANWGGGVVISTLNGCLLENNAAAYGGGGVLNSTLKNCTVVSNTVPSGPGTYSGAGVLGGTLNNCIIYYNNGENCTAGAYGISMNHSCTTPAFAGLNNISSPPLFLDQANNNFRLQSSSPCVNVGNNNYTTLAADLDGRPRFISGLVDMGAYEFQGPFDQWLQQYGLATGGSVDFTDPDQDRMNNWQEWVAGTVPTNSASLLRLVSTLPSNPGRVVTWESVINRTYFLERATNLAMQPPFSLLASNLPGQIGVTSFTDTNAVGAGPFFYRVGVQQ